MSLWEIALGRERGSFPRVSGDEPHASDPAYGRAMFSPRERG